MELTVVHVTVGTTQFESLIKEITTARVLEVLKQRKCKKLILQLGKSTPVDAEHIQREYNIEVEQYEFKFETTRSDILAADLVIGHAGAGTCMDILRNNKPGLVVINRELMSDHQMELAVQLDVEGYIYNCDVSELCEKLQTLDFQALRKYSTSETKDNMQLFVRYLNNLISQS